VLESLCEAIESGVGLPALARLAARALGVSIALLDRSSAVLAVAASSPAEESRLLSGGSGIETVELRVAGATVGELRWRPRGEVGVAPAGARIVFTLLALEVERARSPEWASDEAGSELVRAILDRGVTDRGDIAARAAEAGAEVGEGAGVVVARLTPHAPQTGEWRPRALTIALRALRAASRGAIATLGEADGERAEVAAIVPAAGDGILMRAAAALERELDVAFDGFSVAVGYGRRAADPADLHRAGTEALLAANVGEAEGRPVLAFEDTGSYRLLLPAMSEDAGELERFYRETVAPLAAYDDQYATELVATVEAYLESDGAVRPAAERLHTHRHTVRYRLERVRELSGHDVTSTEGREKLGLGLKAMRVLGISPPRGPALEPRAGGGRSRRSSEEEWE
jgi:hypothetical protein